jgi:hypothetical protein
MLANMQAWLWLGCDLCVAASNAFANYCMLHPQMHLATHCVLI